MWKGRGWCFRTQGFRKRWQTWSCGRKFCLKNKTWLETKRKTRILIFFIHLTVASHILSSGTKFLHISPGGQLSAAACGVAAHRWDVLIVLVTRQRGGGVIKGFSFVGYVWWRSFEPWVGRLPWVLGSLTVLCLAGIVIFTIRLQFCSFFFCFSMCVYKQETK